MKDKLKTGAMLVVTLVGVGALVMLLPAGANAATGDDPALDAIQALGPKITSYVTAIVALVVLSMGAWLGIKYLRKGTSKA